MIDIIIPVFNAFEDLRRCLESVLAFTPPGQARLILIDDASTDIRIAPFLSSLAATHADRISHLTQPHNVGFVQTVNRGMGLSQSDVVLLNSDTQVTAHWLDHLIACAQSEIDVATVTPFSNNAEICSYPDFCQNTLVSDLDLKALCSALDKVHDGTFPQIPTAVGFCMYIRREVLDRVGAFDADRFGRGYGEENDFCLRSTAAGFKHLLCVKALVIHHGGRSFQGDTQELKVQNLATLLQTYPDYQNQISAFIKLDPIAPYRDRVKAHLNSLGLNALGQKVLPGLLLVTHALGGGVEKHVEDITKLLSGQLRVEILRPEGAQALSLQDAQGNRCVIDSNDWASVISLLQSRQYARMHLHHVQGFSSQILSLAEQLNLPMDVTIHDFASYCPQNSLSTVHGLYCGEPALAGCELCVSKRPHAWGLTVADWRLQMHTLLQQADRVIAPSEIVAKKLQNHWHDLMITVWPHPPRTEWLEVAVEKHKVLVLGGLSPTKGLHRVLSCAVHAQLYQLPLHFILVGFVSEKIATFPELPITITGQYEDADLPALLAMQRADSIWFPSQVPETYSYTLDAALDLDLPIFADHGTGAVAERLIQLGKNQHLIPIDTPTAEINTYILKSVPLEPTAVSTSPSAGAAQRMSYAIRLTEWINHQTPKNDVPTLNSLAHQFAAPLHNQQVLSLTTLFEHGVWCGHLPSKKALEQRVIEADRLYEALDGIAKRSGQPWYVHLDTLQKNVNSTQAALSSTQEKLTVTQESLNQVQNILVQRLNSAETQLHETQQFLKDKLTQLDKSNEHSELLQQKIDGIHHDFRRAVDEGALRESQLIQIYENSISWRLTAPLRKVSQMIKFFMRPMLNALRLVRRGLQRWPFALQILKEQGPKALLKRIQEKLSPPKPSSATPIYAADLSPVGSLLLETCPADQTPKISIIIPVYGQHHYTFNCLESLQNHTDLSEVEIIVVDDASPQDAQSELAQVQGVHWVRNSENLGFIRSCNKGANLAKGEYIVLLNNDVRVTSNWLQALLNVYALRSDTGMVGAKLVYPDGQLQEAGGIVWRDGSAWNWGRGQDPELPTFKYLRPADYCSGACLLITTAFWNQLHGFDTAFVPAYYEDTDLAFRVRAAGKTVYYQPEATIIHYEGISSGTDETQGVKKHQVINQKTFFTRWQPTLESHQANGVAPWREVNRWAHKHILIIEACMITPDQDSGSVRMQALLEILIGMGVHVSFVAENMEYREPYVRDLRQQGVEVWHWPHIQSVKQLIETQGQQFDAVMISRHYIARPLIKVVRQHAPQAQLWFDTVDLHYLREERLAALEQSSRLADVAAVTKQQELDVIASCDLTFVVSPVEQTLLAHALPDAKVAILSNIHEPLANTANYNEREGLLFVGGFQHPPNVDAVTWFVQEVWPLLHAQAPEIQVRIVGSKMPDTLRSLASPGIEILGFVQDIDPLLAQSRISIAPLRYGAGVKGKVNQAMSHGLPVVATPAAVEGMDLIHGEQVLVADTPLAYAQEIVRLYNDPVLWQKLVEGGKINVAKTFSRDVAREVLARQLKM